MFYAFYSFRALLWYFTVFSYVSPHFVISDVIISLSPLAPGHFFSLFPSPSGACCPVCCFSVSCLWGFFLLRPLSCASCVSSLFLLLLDGDWYRFAWFSIPMCSCHNVSLFLAPSHLDSVGHSDVVIVPRFVLAVSFPPWCVLPRAWLRSLHLFGWNFSHILYSSWFLFLLHILAFLFLLSCVFGCLGCPGFAMYSFLSVLVSGVLVLSCCFLYSSPIGW